MRCSSSCTGSSAPCWPAVAGFIWLGVSGKPELKSGIRRTLHEEFTRAASGRVTTLDAYRKLEERLFAELQREVYQRIDRVRSAGTESILDWQSRRSRPAFAENFNRTFELAGRHPTRRRAPDPRPHGFALRVSRPGIAAARARLHRWWRCAFPATARHRRRSRLSTGAIGRLRYAWRQRI